MRCPVCLTRLDKQQELRRYQTLIEHCSNPNSIPPPRPIYKCPNNCHSGFYGIYGGLYSKTRESLNKWIAINSHMWRIRYWDLWERIWLNEEYEMLSNANDFLFDRGV